MSDAKDLVTQGPAVEVRDLSVRFGDFYAVKNVSFSVPVGEIFGFLGANGAGKTTTIRVLCGLLEPSTGQVRVGGIGFENGGEAIKRKVGYMSQKFTLYEDLTVEENLDFTASLRKLAPEFYRERRQALLDFISFSRPLDTFVRDLPGGIRQQVSLAAALLHDPEIIFLDEPTAGVTPAARARFWALIRELASRGKTVFVTTHYMDEAENCGRIALMRAGELIALDSPAALKQKAFPAPLYELSPLDETSAQAIASLRHDPVLLSLQPYGIRYHVVARSAADWQSLLPRLENHFAIREITPSLEDVFIQVVEGGNR
ncbi:MAG: ABC transporter ATP-binding protein [Oligoflexia bacterium]|nr:ABC transporter ATP-binding protein [Oligoflexia bacterium]